MVELKKNKNEVKLWCQVMKYTADTINNKNQNDHNIPN